MQNLKPRAFSLPNATTATPLWAEVDFYLYRLYNNIINWIVMTSSTLLASLTFKPRPHHNTTLPACLEECKAFGRKWKCFLALTNSSRRLVNWMAVSLLSNNKTIITILICSPPRCNARPQSVSSVHSYPLNSSNSLSSNRPHILDNDRNIPISPLNSTTTAQNNNIKIAWFDISCNYVELNGFSPAGSKLWLLWLPDLVVPLGWILYCVCCGAMSRWIHDIILKIIIGQSGRVMVVVGMSSGQFMGHWRRQRPQLMTLMMALLLF